MSGFFWGMFCGAAATAFVSFTVAIAISDYETDKDLNVTLTAACLTVVIFLAIAFGTMFYQGPGTIQVIPPTPTPLLGR